MYHDLCHWLLKYGSRIILRYPLRLSPSILMHHTSLRSVVLITYLKQNSPLHSVVDSCHFANTPWSCLKEGFGDTASCHTSSTCRLSPVRTAEWASKAHTQSFLAPYASQSCLVTGYVRTILVVSQPGRLTSCNVVFHQNRYPLHQRNSRDPRCHPTIRAPSSPGGRPCQHLREMVAPTRQLNLSNSTRQYSSRSREFL